MQVAEEGHLAQSVRRQPDHRSLAGRNAKPPPDAPGHQVRQTSSAMRSHHNHIAAMRLRGGKDRIGENPSADRGLHCQPLLRQGGAHIGQPGFRIHSCPLILRHGGEPQFEIEEDRLEHVQDRE